MATIKAVSSKSGIGAVIGYVTKKEKTEAKLLSGYNCSPETVADEMMVTKMTWNKTEGRTYKHFVQSFHKDEAVTPELAHELANEFVNMCPQFRGFEVLVATHKDREHIHTHFIMNSVSFEDGHKFRMHKSELQQMKDISDKLCRKYGLSITEKGKTFEGAKRETVSAYDKDVYKLLLKAQEGKVQSYVQKIANGAIMSLQSATSKEDFIEKMKAHGVGVDWQDNHKYITFIDLELQNHGEERCKVRNKKLQKYYNVDLTKESLENVFEKNSMKVTKDEMLSLDDLIAKLSVRDEERTVPKRNTPPTR